MFQFFCCKDGKTISNGDPAHAAKSWAAVITGECYLRLEGGEEATTKMAAARGGGIDSVTMHFSFVSCARAHPAFIAGSPLPMVLRDGWCAKCNAPHRAMHCKGSEFLYSTLQCKFCTTEDPSAYV